MDTMPGGHPPPAGGQSGAGSPAEVLTVNVGSSSIKFAFFTAGPDPARRLSGQVERIGQPGTSLRFKDPAGTSGSAEITSGAMAGVMRELLDWFGTQPVFGTVRVVAHRLVHGGPKYYQPERVTPALLDDLQRISPLDPDHLPAELQMIHAFGERHPHLAQAVCFDTAFHEHMPRVARLLPIPRRYEAMGVQRYGFHGLSYTYLLDELDRLDGRSKKSGRVILAHLGNGASMAAVKDGACIDTSMAFTPTAGLPMSTRSGDLDPGVFSYLIRTAGLTPGQFDDMVNHESGLLGISGTSSDMRDLIARAGDDVRAAEAVALFCYQARKWVGGFAAALGGLDTLVFAGGIGEKSSAVRARICAGLEFLGLQIDEARNARDDATISRSDSRVAVRVIPTDEEIVLARAALALAPPP
jgi:acetate kinase